MKQATGKQATGKRRRLRNWIQTPFQLENGPMFRIVSADALQEAIDGDLTCAVVMGVGEWILRIECTEREIARGPIAGIRFLLAENNLPLGF